MKILFFPLLLSALFVIGAGPAGASETGGVATKENLDLPGDAGGDTGDDEEGLPEIIFFYDRKVEGDAFFFCLDRSSTMTGDKFRRLQNEVVKNIRNFTPRVQFSIVFFDAGLKMFPATGGPIEATEETKRAAIAFVLSVTTGRGTCAKPALMASLEAAKRSTARWKTILFLGDGINTCPGTGPTYTEEILREVAARNTGRAKINVFGVSPPPEGEDWLRKLAAQNGGTYGQIPQ